MIFKKFIKGSIQGLLVSTSLVLLAVVHRHLRTDEGDSAPSYRFLYESDDNDNCLEDEFCRFTLGLVLLAVTPLIIFWNEHQHVRLETLYSTAKRDIHDLQSPKYFPSSDMDGKFVCFSGRLTGETTLSDDLFPCITVHNALLLVREIEIYQYIQKRKGKTYKLKEEWCKIPQPDPSKFPEKKNSNGNWELFADKSRMVNTGHKINGKPIEFGDNVVVFQAPSPSIGVFAIPPELMDEAFLGERHVHRLAELELIKESQGKWTTVELQKERNMNPQSLELVSEGVHYCHRDGAFIYDGNKDRNGTIRLQWRFAKPQDMTVAAEAVPPGRTFLAGYSSMGRNIRERGTIVNMIMQDLSSGFEESPLLPKEKQSKMDQWSVTPFSVKSTEWYPPYRDKFLGRLWLYAPGLFTSEQLFRRAYRASARCLWKVRRMSYVALFIGWCLVFEPLTNIFRVPILRSLLSLTFASFAFVLATTCCLSCTAIARITARPMQSILLIVTIWVIVVEFSNKLTIVEPK